MTSVLHELIAKTKIAAGNATVGIVDDDHGMKSAMVCVGLGLAALAEAISQTDRQAQAEEAERSGRGRAA